MLWPLRLRDTPNNEWPEGLQPGDTFKQVHELADGSEVTHWYVILPNGAHWSIYGKMSDGSPGWDIRGELPNITAWPSINCHPNRARPGYHGWITNGVLSDDIEGRSY